MTYARTAHGERAHIWDPETLPQDRAMCGVIASRPYSASEEDIREAEGNLCRRCERIRQQRVREGRY